MSYPSVLDMVLAELKRESGVLAVFLTGSYARGEADAWSDLDISVLVEADVFVRNTVAYRAGLLVSVERSTPSHRERAFTDPETALWNLGSLRSGQALHDPAGVFAALQERARAFVWVEVEPQAHARAAALLAGSTEELHKVMGGLQAGDVDKLAFALVGLTFALGNAALLGTGTLIPTENRYLSAARGAWTDPVWRECYACLTGVSGEGIVQRGRAALRAYERAVALTRWPDGPDRVQAQEAARRADAFLRG
ncbi:nucleotidyltransferase domain-containing protein [Deinococcus arcticus]|uniref:Nucleotidyltransferase domain-containing protein n=1 Tax=Deinococcus arcticus TaxID=2136176 RepID=A0A2T3W8U6_9DEIO|nr:nucleotidyltransferase domain-containing protein [Deinococcus arcticus]PTA68316.1 nucleotidyltransferase domain-containing protein [Deinococcus arcticus]